MFNTYTTIQVRCYTNKKGYKRLDEILEMLRTLYNAGLQERIEAWDHSKTRITLNSQYKQLTEIRKDDNKWRELSIFISRNTLYRLDKSFTNFFRRIKKKENPGYPRFKSENRYRSIDFISADMSLVNIKNSIGKIQVKGLPFIKFIILRTIPEKGKLITFRLVKKIKGWYVDLVYEISKEILPKTNQNIGIDVGVNQRLTLSNGEIIERREIDKSKEKQLQQELSRCKKGSNRRKKKVMQLRRETYRQQVKNRNECHQITSDIIRQFDKIAIEKLDIKQMTHKGKRELNREVLSQTWGIIFQQLRCKAENAGRELVEVNPAYTSQICSNCGDVTPQDEYRTHKCVSCGLVIDRDFNAAINIRNKAFGVGSSPTHMRELQTA